MAKKINVIIVVSELNYIPSNGYDFLHLLFKENNKDITGIIFIQNFSFSIFFTIFYLYILGCKNFASALLKNTVSVFFDKKKALCKQYNIPIVKTHDINSNKIISWLKQKQVDVIINMRTRYKFKKELLTIPTYGCINIHHGILPKYRGLYCDLYALYENRPAGFSIHEMTETLDDGKILYVKKVSDTNETDYLKYLSLLPLHEMKAVNTIIAQIKKKKIKKHTILNQNPMYTTTPTYTQIKKMRHAGMIL
jgi:methionyl-tRNA formyltransferase